MTVDPARLAVTDLRVALDGREVLHEVSFEVAAGERLVVLGPSGGGKTTLLRAVAGLEPVETGRVAVDGRDLAAVPPERRGMGMVFQEHALFAHRDVAGNVGFGLRMAGWEPARIRARVAELLDLVGLAGLERRAVLSLSGGERQRVALARALATSPSVLLLDEPLGALDRTLRDRLVDELDRVFTDLGVTAVHVTHDQEEAFALADRVAILREGRVVQIGTPREVWARPADPDTARLLGLTNVVDGAELAPWGITPAGAFVVRPEAVSVWSPTEPPASTGPARRGRVVAVRFRGGPSSVRVAVDDGPELVAELASGLDVRAGAEVLVAVDPAGVVRFGSA